MSVMTLMMTIGVWRILNARSRDAYSRKYDIAHMFCPPKLCCFLSDTKTVIEYIASWRILPCSYSCLRFHSLCKMSKTSTPWWWCYKPQSHCCLSRLIATVWSLPSRDLLQVNFCLDEAPTHFWAKLASQRQPNLLSLTSYIKNVALFRDVLQLFQI